MQAVILAGGKGTRLGKLTKTAPKPMLIVNKKPFLEHLLIQLKKNGINDVVLCVGYLSHKIIDYFKDGSAFGLKISYSVEKRLLGTGGALKKAERFLKQDFILLNGDTYVHVDYRNLLNYFCKINKKGLIVVYRKRGNASIKGDLVTDYDKKSKKMEFTDAGVQVFKKNFLRLIAPNKALSLEEKVFPMLIKQRQLAAYVTKEKFYDIGTLKGLRIIKHVLK